MSAGYAALQHRYCAVEPGAPVCRGVRQRDQLASAGAQLTIEAVVARNQLAVGCARVPVGATELVEHVS